MDVKLTKNIFMFSLSLPIALMHTASFAKENILCPAVNIVQSSYQKLDTAQKLQDKYIAYTATSFLQSDNLWWFSGVGDITAVSSDDAIKKGKIILKEANVAIDVYAKKVGNEYICNYGPGFIQARGKYF